MQSWPIHAKLIGRIDLDAITSLDGTPATADTWQHELQWLRNDERYQHVPILDAQHMPGTRYKRSWMERLIECGVVTRIDPARVRGHVKMFIVPEVAKERFRSIKHTAAINSVCGRDTLSPCTFPSKADIAGFVNQGDCFIALDFAAYYDQFALSEEVSSRMCFKFNKLCFCLRKLAMGQRQAVGIANAATQRLLDFPRRSCACRSIIDNVIFVGSRDDVVHDAWIFIQRCKQVNATLNEIDVKGAALVDVQQLVKTSGDWAGIHLDCDGKSVCLTEKAVAKTRASWENRSLWTWRDYAAHVGLLFWTWNIIDVPIAEFFDLLRFNSNVGKLMTETQPSPRPDGSYPRNPVWDLAAVVPPSVWPVLQLWSQLVFDNAPRPVRQACAPQLLLECDASGLGYGYASYNIETDEYFEWGAPWTYDDRVIHGDKLGKSTYSEPLGMRRSIQHAMRRNAGAKYIAVGTDNTVTEASYNRGFNSHSFNINRCVKLFLREFPRSAFSFSFTHVPGVDNLGDAPSRGLTNCEVLRDYKISMLRRHLGLQPAQVG